MAKGRKPGPVRWNDFQKARIWAAIAFVVERDRIDVRAAINRVVNEGYFQVRKEKVWLTRPPRDADKNAPLIHALKRKLKPGDSRNDNPNEQLRDQYYQAEKRRETDPGFRADCDLWLTFLHKRHAAPDGDPIQTFFDSMDEQ
jgi:hypothetical protein